MHRWKESGRGAAVAVVVVLLAIGLRLVIVKIRRRGNEPRSGTLKILSNPDDAKFDIVAVHGLGADPDHTWSHAIPAESVDRTQEPKPTERGGPAYRSMRIHLLRDILCKDFPEARILSFEHNSRWLADAPVKTTEEIGKSLLEEIEAGRPQRRLPIIFIGHSLGGIVIKQALCRNDAQEIINDTSGIIFLGTPHHGSDVSIPRPILGLMTRFLGSDPTLLLSLGRHAKQLSNLVDTFQSCIAKNERRRSKLRIISFYETKQTYLLGWLSIGLVVSRDSAVVHADENNLIDTDHSGLNKCAGSEDQLYVQLKRAIDRLKAPSRLEQADTLLRNKHYKGDRLSIVRLSRKELPMDQCYINLAIVEQIGNAGHGKEGDAAPSSHSLFARQKVETPDKTVQVELPGIFNQRKAHGENPIQPRRILIRGQAGVGKTTLCKKIVYDFTHDTQTVLHRSWTKLFDRLLWVPLRNLKNRSRTGYNLKNLFYDEYFAQEHDGHVLAEELWRDIDRGKTLFVLDGLDEVSHKLHHNDEMFPFLMELLDQPNVIITSRPNANLPVRVKDLHLELETIGFYPEQVRAYLEADPKIKPRANEVQSFLQDHWLMQGLVRIPILLDALCYTWEGFPSGTAPDTMTRIYEAIVLKLWKKDIVRLEKSERPERLESQVVSARRPEILRFIAPESDLLECLAFNGLYSDVIDFTPAQRDDIVEQCLLRLRLDHTLDDTLAKISFMRTSNPLSDPEDRNYHFTHLTFQEYFAAQYFVRKWKNNEQLEYVFNKKQNPHSDPLIDPVKFLQRHKYSAHYDVFWRFVSGLLDFDEKRDTETLRFFQNIEEEPRDLLGPVHQRLVMHCLNELVPREGKLTKLSQFQSKLEDQLSRWLLFECEFTKTAPRLTSKGELSDQVLLRALAEASDETKILILTSLESRPVIQESIIKRASSWLSDGTSLFLKLTILRMLGLQQVTWAERSLKLAKYLAACLEDEDWRVRQAAVQALQNRHDLRPENVNAIAGRLGDEDPYVRQAAVQALQNRHDLRPENVNAIAGRLGDEDPGVRQAAVQALQGRHDLRPEDVNAIAGRLGDRHPDVRRVAVRALQGRHDLRPENVNAIAGRLGDEDPYVRQAAVQALQNRHDFRPEDVNVIAGRLEDEDPDVRRVAVRALQDRHDLRSEDVNAIAGRLEDEDWRVRQAAVQALQNRHDLRPENVNAIAGRLGNEDPYARQAAVQALQGRHDLLPENVNAIAGRLGDGHPGVRWGAVQALQGRHDLRPEDVNAIAGRLGDGHPGVRQAAVQALQNRHDLRPENVNAIAGRLRDRHPGVRWGAVQALQGRHDLRPGDVNAIARRLGDRHSYVRQAAVRALQGRHDLRPENVNAIAGRLGDRHPGVRWGAVHALKTRHDLSSDNINTIAGPFGDEDSYVRLLAVQALQNRHDLSSDNINTIAGRFGDEDSHVRQAAVQALQNRHDFSLHVDKNMKSLYQTLMEKSFFQHLYWYIADETTYIVFDVQEVPFKGEQDRFRNTLQKLRKRLNIPVP